MGRARGGDRARHPGPRALRGAAEAGEARRIGRARPRRRLVGALPGRAGGAQGGRGADPAAASRSPAPRSRRRPARWPSLSRSSSRRRSGSPPSSRRSTAARWSRGWCASSRGSWEPSRCGAGKRRTRPRRRRPPRAPRRDPAASASAASFGDAPRRARAGAGPRRSTDSSAGVRAASGVAAGAVTSSVAARQARRPRPHRTSRRGERRRGCTRQAGGDHQAGLRAQTQALGRLVEAARGRRSDRLAVRGALPQDRRDPGGRRAGAARAHRRVLRLRLRSPPRRPRRRPAPAGSPGGPSGGRSPSASAAHHLGAGAPRPTC